LTQGQIFNKVHLLYTLAQALLQMLKHQGRVPKGGKDDMRGIMLCFGYRPERRTGGPVNSYVSHNCDDSLEACKKQWACFVDALKHDLNVYCPVQAMESAKVRPDGTIYLRTS